MPDPAEITAPPHDAENSDSPESLDIQSPVSDAHLENIVEYAPSSSLPMNLEEPKPTPNTTIVDSRTTPSDDRPNEQSSNEVSCSSEGSNEPNSDEVSSSEEGLSEPSSLEVNESPKAQNSDAVSSNNESLSDQSSNDVISRAEDSSYQSAYEVSSSDAGSNDLSSTDEGSSEPPAVSSSDQSSKEDRPSPGAPNPDSPLAASSSETPPSDAQATAPSDSPFELTLEDAALTLEHLLKVYDRLSPFRTEPVTVLAFDSLLKKCVKDLNSLGYQKYFGRRNIKHLLLDFSPYFQCSTRISPADGVERDIVELNPSPAPPQDETTAEIPRVLIIAGAGAKKIATKTKSAPIPEPLDVKPEVPEAKTKEAKRKAAKEAKEAKRRAAQDRSFEPEELAPPIKEPIPAKAVKGGAKAAVDKEALSSVKPKKAPGALEPLAKKTKETKDDKGLFDDLTETPSAPWKPAALEEAVPNLTEGFVAPPALASDSPPELAADSSPEPAPKPARPTKTVDPLAYLDELITDDFEEEAVEPVKSFSGEPREEDFAQIFSDREYKPTPILAPKPASIFAPTPTSEPTPEPEPRALPVDLRQTIPRAIKTAEYLAPINVPLVGTISEVNFDRNFLTVKEEDSGLTFQGNVHPPNVSWSMLKILRERGEANTKVDFILKPNADNNQFVTGFPVIAEFKLQILDEKINRGLAIYFHDIVYMPKVSSGPSALHPTYDQMLERLAQFALPEKWYYSDTRRPFNHLDNYFMKTFQSLQKEKLNKFLDIFSKENRIPELLELNDSGLAFSADCQLTAMNSGLLDRSSRDVLIVFRKTDPLQKRYVFKGFTSSSDNALGKEVSTKIHPWPNRVTYFQKPEEIIYQNPPIDLDQHAQLNHIIIDGIRRGRFPARFIKAVCPAGFEYYEDTSLLRSEELELKNAELVNFIEKETSTAYTTIKEKLKTAIELTRRQIVANPRIPLPYLNPSQDKLAFILPLALTDPRDYDVSIVVEQITDGDGGVIKPFVHTILTLSMASKGARLLSSLQDTWLGVLKNKSNGPAVRPVNAPQPDFPALNPLRTSLSPPPKALKTLSPQPPVLTSRPRPRPSAAFTAPKAPTATPSPPKIPFTQAEIKGHFAEELRYYSQPSVNELSSTFLLKVFDFCVGKLDPQTAADRMVPLQFFHEVLVAIVPRLSSENGGYRSFNHKYSDLTDVFLLNRSFFELRKNRADRAKYVLMSFEREPTQPVTASSSVRQGLVVGSIAEKNLVSIYGEDQVERKARVKDPYDLFLIQDLLAKEGVDVEVNYHCTQLSPVKTPLDAPRRAAYYDISDIHSSEIEPDLRAVLNTSFPNDFFPELANRLKEDLAYNGLYQLLFNNLRTYMTSCLEIRKYMALNSLANNLAQNGSATRPDFTRAFSGIFLLKGFSEATSQNYFSFNLNLQNSQNQTIFATFHRSSSLDTFFRFYGLTALPTSGLEVLSTKEAVQKWINEILPPEGATLNLTLTDEAAWSRVIWFGSEYRIIPPSLAADAEECRFLLSRSFHQATQEFAQNPKGCLLAFDSVSRKPTIVLPLSSDYNHGPNMTIGFRLSYSRNTETYYVDPGSVRLFSLQEAYHRAQVINPVEDSWLTRALLASQTN
ncbi:MAG: DUF3825 domain-containing protein [Deltaproteobacteria bacterium]|nr:DUF3825 domain-containing protein [Deltaproteobacteria bacterium]